MSDYGRKWEQQKGVIDRATKAVTNFKIVASTPAEARTCVMRLIHLIDRWEAEEQAMKDLPE